MAHGAGGGASLLLIASLLVSFGHGLDIKRRTGEPPEHPEISMTPDSQLFGPPFSVPLVGVDPLKQISIPIQMQLAITPDEDHHGLMFKKSLDENAGMLFLYKDSAKRVLYMRNTLIPLDAGWFTHDGTLKEVMQMSTPMDETWRWSQDSDIQWGLEMNLDWFKHMGVKPGEVKLDMDALRIAISSRGYNPSDYGIGNSEEVAAASAPADQEAKWVPVAGGLRLEKKEDSVLPPAQEKQAERQEEQLEKRLTSALDEDPAPAKVAGEDKMVKFLGKAEEAYMQSS